MLGDVTRECINLIYDECNKKQNKKKIQYTINCLTEILLCNIRPYLYTILAILLTMFFMNCFQFYYYIRMFLKTKTSVSVLDMTSLNN